MNYLESYIFARNINAIKYKKMFNYVGLTNYIKVSKNNYDCNTYSQFAISLLRDRDKLKEYLYGRGITTAVYYSVLLYLQSCFSHLKYKLGSFSAAEYAAKYTSSLPFILN